MHLAVHLFSVSHQCISSVYLISVPRQCISLVYLVSVARQCISSVYLVSVSRQCIWIVLRPRIWGIATDPTDHHEGKHYCFWSHLREKGLLDNSLHRGHNLKLCPCPGSVSRVTSVLNKVSRQLDQCCPTFFTPQAVEFLIHKADIHTKKLWELWLKPAVWAPKVQSMLLWFRDAEIKRNSNQIWCWYTWVKLAGFNTKRKN